MLQYCRSKMFLLCCSINFSNNVSLAAIRFGAEVEIKCMSYFSKETKLLSLSPIFVTSHRFFRDVFSWETKKIKSRNHKVSKFHLSDSVCSDLASVIANTSTDMKQKAMNDDKTVEYNNNNNNKDSNNNCNGNNPMFSNIFCG